MFRIYLGLQGSPMKVRNLVTLEKVGKWADQLMALDLEGWRLEAANVDYTLFSRQPRGLLGRFKAKEYGLLATDR